MENAFDDGWRELVRDKLEPMGWLIPVGDGLHEWSKTYRDLVFVMAGFLRSHPGTAEEVAAAFLLTSEGALCRAHFAAEEVIILFRKVSRYGLAADAG